MKSTRSGVTTRLLLWAERWTLHGVRDVYSGQSLPVERDEEDYVGVPLVLEPGGGRLLTIVSRGAHSMPAIRGLRGSGWNRSRWGR
jgi:hypothetical protein